MSLQPEKKAALEERMARLGVKENDLIEKFVLGSGRGGQNLQKTASCVYIKHLPTGIEVKCGRERERETNRFLARRQLCDLIEEKLLGKQSPKQLKIDKIRRQKKRRARRRLT